MWFRHPETHIELDLDLYGQVQIDGQLMRVASDRSGVYYLVRQLVPPDGLQYEMMAQGPYQATMKEVIEHWAQSLRAPQLLALNR